MPPRNRTYILVTLLALGSSACLERCAPGRVGPGVARLTVRNVGAVVQLVNDDTRCGFESPDVKYAFTTEGEVGGLGSATWTVDGCALDFTEESYVTEDCAGVKTSMSGRVVVNAHRTIRGTLTGDPEQPVVPVGPDAVEIELVDAELHDFRVESSDSDARLTWISGQISAKARPRLAASAPEGICMIPTPNIEMAEIEYRDAKVHVVGEGRRFYVDVPSSRFGAVNGRVKDQENYIGGRIDVWGSQVHFDGGDDGLNPDYDPTRFLESFSCEEDLALPITFACENVAPVLAQGAARLTVRSLGTVAKLVEDDARCGFSSPEVLEAVRITEGQVGYSGRAEFSVAGCTLELPEPTVVGTSCTGTETVVSGKVTVTAKKVLKGRLTGDLEEPVVPLDDAPAELVFERIEAEGFRVDEAGNALEIVRGAFAGRLEPRVAMDVELGACGFTTPIARFSDVSYLEPSEVIVDSEQGRFQTTIEDANLTALNGRWGAEENLLDGHIALMGEAFTLPTNPSDDGLDPEYDRAAFDAGWQCGSLDTEAPFECHFVDPLAQGAAQLTALLLGTLANTLEEDTACGFSSDPVRFSPEITGELGKPGGAGVFHVSEPCVLRFEQPTVLREDCHGKQTVGRGTVRLTGTKTLRGYVSGDPVEPIVPTTQDPAEIRIEADFTDFELWTEPGDNAVAVHSGKLSGTVRPRTAIDTETGACSLPTAVVKMEQMIWSNAALRIESEGRAFEVEVPASNLTAVNGRRGGEENTIEGAISIDGELVAIPVRGQGLDPEYDAATFVDSFLSCEPNMELPVKEEDCDMSKPLGEGAARLIIAALGAVTGAVNEDTGCGYSKLGVLTDPSRVLGRPGQRGLMEWEIEDCSPGEHDEEDCLGRETFVQGDAFVTGRRTVEGIREEIEILFIRIDSIVPDGHDVVRIEHDDIRFEDFETYDVDPGEQVPLRGIRFESGHMRGIVEPMTGRSDADGAYDVPTKTARMTNVHLEDAPASILFEGKRFDVYIERADLTAFNGAFRGERNRIEGEVVVDGKVIALPLQDLDPEYDQETFDRRYACTDELDALLPP